MVPRKTHFAQVPLTAIKKIVEEEQRRKKIKGDEETLGTNKKDAGDDTLETATAPGRSARK